MSPPAANTRSRSATPNNTPAKARGQGSPPSSVGTKLFSALSLRGSSPESDDDQQTTQTATSLLRINLFGFLGANPKAHEDDQLRAEFSSLLEEYTKAERVASSDPIFCVARNYFDMKEYKLVLIGSASVGKSAYVEKLRSNRFVSKYEPTEKVEVTSLVFNTNHFPVKVDVWEVGGCEPFDGYYVSADAAMLMYDMSSKPSMKELTSRYESFRRVCEDVPAVLVGNKAESSSKRKVQQKDVCVTFRRKNKLQHYEISTKNGLNFQKPLLFLLKKLTGKRDLELIGNEPSGKKSAEKLQTTGRARTSTLNDSSNSSPDVLESASKMEMKKKSPNEAKGRSNLDVSVAAATPLPKIDEEGI